MPNVLVKTGNYNINAYVGWWSEENISTNQSTVYCYFFVQVPSGWNIGPWTDNAGSYVGRSNLTFNGSIENIGAGNHIISDTKTFTVDHNNDGTCSTKIYWKWGVRSSWGGFYEASGDFNITLPTIPRQANITGALDITDNSTPSISFSTAGTGTLDVWLEPNPNGSHLCIRTNIPNTGYYDWILTESERNQLRNACSGKNCTLRYGLYTTINGTQYVSYIDKKLTVQETDTTKPSVTLQVSNDNTSIPATVRSIFNDMYIQGKSRLNVSISATGQFGATIREYSTPIDGKSYNESSFTSDFLSAPGNKNIKTTVTDSRNFTNSGNENILVYEYSKPKIIPVSGTSEVKCYRSDNNGNQTNNSNKIWIKAKKDFYLLDNKNSCTLRWRYKLSSETWENQPWYILQTTNNEYDALIDGTFTITNTYTIQIGVIDTLGEYDSLDFDIPTDDVPLHLGKGGKSVGIGRYADTNDDYSVKVGWETTFDEDVHFSGEVSYDGEVLKNFIIEQGQYNNGTVTWNYKKYKNGDAECWTNNYQTTANMSSWGSMYIGYINSPGRYPITFISPPIVDVYWIRSNFYCSPIWALHLGSSTDYSVCPDLQLCDSNPPPSDPNFTLGIKVTGKWK